MSLWLQTATEKLVNSQFQSFRENLLPKAPIKLPDCIIKELEFGERICENNEMINLFPIRLIWMWEANEQKLFNLKPLVRSRYHPEKLLEVWNRVNSDLEYRTELEATGFEFDFSEKAIQTTSGWILIGDRFVEDFHEIERIMEVVLMFPDVSNIDGRALFLNG